MVILIPFVTSSWFLVINFLSIRVHSTQYKVTFRVLSGLQSSQYTVNKSMLTLCATTQANKTGGKSSCATAHQPPTNYPQTAHQPTTNHPYRPTNYPSTNHQPPTTDPTTIHQPPTNNLPTT